MLSLLLILLLPSPTTAAVPATRNTTTSSPTLSMIGYSDTGPTYKCTKSRWYKSDKRPYFSECYRAIRNLPQTHERGEFHSKGIYNKYYLPKTEQFGNCRAQVEVEGRDAMSSWVMVASTLDQLSVQCRRVTPMGDRTAGWMMVAPANRIKVSLLGPDDPYTGVGVTFPNGTGGGLSERRDRLL